MTLFRQLLVFTLILLVLLFAGIWFEKLQSTRSFLLTQLQSHAQDTATSLGLSLSPVMAEQDLSQVDAMISAVFDRGYYTTITLRDIRGKVINEKTLKLEIAGVPDWFVKLVPIASPGAESLVMAGWTQAGKLYVESHPGFAYQTMWQTMRRTGIYFFLAGATILVLGGLCLRLLLRPLKRVELQAEAICRKEYHVQERLPRTRELRQVVDSMNRMTIQVRDMFSGQAKIAERLRRKAYTDQLTGLGNRRYLTAQIETRLEAVQAAAHGALLMLQVDNLQKINETEGFTAGDSLLKKIALILKQETKTYADVALARLTGGDFALLLSGVSAIDAGNIAKKLSQAIKRLALENTSHSATLAHIGGAIYEESTTPPELLAVADNALQSARRKGANLWHITHMASGQAAVGKGKLWWRDTLEKVLERDDIILFSQPVVSSGDQSRVLQEELLSRIALGGGEIVSADIFVPLAERLQLISKLDKVVLRKIFAQKKVLTDLKTIAVNLAPSSLSDKAFVEWILAELNRLPDKSIHIIFEFPEFGAVHYLELMKSFSKKVGERGHAIGLDHFGQSLSNFGYLQSLRPEYVKIDRTFIKELEHNQGDSEFFIGALCGVAHSLGIRVIAKGVEQKEQVDMLLELNVDALQGFLFGEPKRL